MLSVEEIKDSIKNNPRKLRKVFYLSMLMEATSFALICFPGLELLDIQGPISALSWVPHSIKNDYFYMFLVAMGVIIAIPSLIFQGRMARVAYEKDQDK